MKRGTHQHTDSWECSPSAGSEPRSRSAARGGWRLEILADVDVAAGWNSLEGDHPAVWLGGGAFDLVGGRLMPRRSGLPLAE